MEKIILSDYGSFLFLIQYVYYSYLSQEKLQKNNPKILSLLTFPNMKKNKSSYVKKSSSSNHLLNTMAIIGVIALVLFFVFSGGDKTPKITPETTEQRTSVCSSESFPVCGKDGKTYTNSCTAEKIADVRVAYVGECREENTDSIEIIPVVDNGSEVDSGIENFGPIPKYMTDREDIVPVEIPSVDTETMVDPLIEIVDPTLIIYFNSTFHYGFSMPKNSYYQAFGAQNGANHSVGIATTDTDVESLATSEVRVYFYANKILAELSGAENGFSTDPVTGTIYILLNEKDSVRIESKNPESPIVQTLVQTIHGE
ncbi:hypothetical protein GW819_00270 [Candidatus Gracilibacteria bacterium]|nr:hypothetical protein [bacterium]NDK19259.1 hypothetical protein [Candidatus Gracilibacteria bacterium]PIQ10764.1 MAG: hypothetical protein COW68_03755 [Candidatus Gracilibacteria bacterium CG18_big_fil_WC_8_21_14_2_50_38_16]PIQ42036.1 MAG: hypothetical protein COW06_00830 [Candidatus Gracilibacteria bacterium CG12_big_fil_rev_8_21_14_0_65_38_15]PIZ01908.1 MAG: hypothetical protein COY60_01295 [Candidatus Gracilibacteria bacterium CG_4_10_14_0_8_um_filter_38_28]